MARRVPRTSGTPLAYTVAGLRKRDDQRVESPATTQGDRQTEEGPFPRRCTSLSHSRFEAVAGARNCLGGGI